MNMEERNMSTREMAYDIINNMSDEQLQGFVMMFRNPSEISLSARISDIENGRNLSETFDTVEDLLEDLNAED
ncbi:MAG: hypothetical protein K2J08_03190 [Ruminococcus sp.]|nr:hypothetical protein [Ruminococcus sp.]